MVWFLLLLMVTACAACSIQTNLDDQCFIFPEKTNTDYVKLHSAIHTFKAITICLRVKTNLHRDHTLVSIATVSEPNALFLLWDKSDHKFEVDVLDKDAHFKGLEYELNKLHSICIAWDSATGLVQMWIDGHHAVPKYVGGHEIVDPNIILGQDQDAYNGGFNKHQSFVGEICDVHVWDYVIEPCWIEDYMEDSVCHPGNAVNWLDLKYCIVGKVYLECEPDCPEDECKEVNHCENEHFWGLEGLTR